MDNPTIDNTKSVNNPSPFITFTARTIPATFDTSMSYQEGLFALVDYLQTQVTPAINDNAVITNEQTKAINELYDFVNHYFDNLDVQEEINNKLDEMVTDGTLDRIINQEIFGELNQAIEEIQSDVTSIGAATSTNTSSITTLSNSVDTRVATLTAKDTELEDDISDVQTSVNSAIAAQNAQIAQITGGLPTVVASTSAMSDSSKIYVLSSNMHIYTYNTTSSQFEGSGIVYGGSTSAITNNEQLIYTSNYSSLLPDLNTAPINKVYHLNFSSGSTSIPAHMPFTTYSGGVGKLTTYSINNTITTGAVQIYENRQYRWIRNATGANTWNAWFKQIPGAHETYQYLITSKNVFPDANNAIPNVSYLISFSSGSTNITEHLPFTSFTGGVGLLETYQESGTAGASTPSTGCFQKYTNRNNTWLRTRNTSDWGDWYPISNREFTVTSSDNLVAVWNIAKNLPNATIIIESGDHDLYQEFMSYYGNDFFVNFDDDTNPKGIQPYNGMTIRGSSNSKITFNYPGSNAKVKQLFSPITSAGIGSWTIDNLNIECSNCRYAIHDEMGGQTSNYKHTIKNCRIKIDNTQNTDWTPSACIGGGLGHDGEIEITGNYFESYGDRSSERLYGVVTYHNGEGTNSRSNLVITGNYIANQDGFRLAAYGSSTKITTLLYSNNNTGHELIVAHETPDSSIDNVSAISWNNIVRTS